MKTKYMVDAQFSPPSVLKYNVVLFFLYVLLVILVHTLNLKGYSGFETRLIVYALYFHIVSVCTTGYGDIDPLSSLTKNVLSFCAYWGWYSQHIILLHLLHN
ncbi:hypothetical protein KSP39_PZI018574 [Platanthera zijinensis]|uniref:Potassium channel domain-containing protein n=1 Tax=Platanthera zijinensis TaxID=2320716 RepID=A0AAP0B2R1_9ASPA